jgi:uncharacterized protein YjbJ (UPF0337 family)
MKERMDTPEEQQARGNWMQFKGRLREAWGSLSDDELDRFEGRKDQLEGHIHEATGEAREKIRDMMDRLSRESRYEFRR